MPSWADFRDIAREYGGLLPSEVPERLSVQDWFREHFAGKMERAARIEARRKRSKKWASELTPEELRIFLELRDDGKW